MEDIAPGLLDAIREEFTHRIQRNRKILTIYDAIQKGTAAYQDVGVYAYEIGDALSRALHNHLSSSVLPDGRMYYNIADRVLRPLLEENQGPISDAALRVQSDLNKKAGIGLKAQPARITDERIAGIVDKVSNADNFDDVAWVLEEPVRTFAQSVVDQTLKANVDFQGRAGLRPKVIRKAGRKCCDWCQALAGEYEYPDVPDDVYRRHQNCRCTVEYDPGDGKRQNVHTKQWTHGRDYDKLNIQNHSGAVTGAKKTPGWEQRHAERYYEEIRNRSPFADARRIAANVGDFTEDQIEKIRQHIFINEQPRSDGMARFDADYDMAQAWQRLVDGKNIRASDRVLLMHEYEELSIMAQTGCTYEEAHEKANQKYNWWQSFMEED